MPFLIVGLSHKTAPVEVREKLAFLKDIPEQLAALTHSQEIQEALLISTCNRVEACLVTSHIAKATEAVEALFCERGQLTRETLQPYLYVREENLAVKHLFRVTAGLDSLVLGEPQIGGQMKEAYTQAVTAASTGPYLNKLLHRAFQVAKKVRSETGIGRHPVSVSYTAVLLAERIFGNLGEKRVLLLGAGEMGRLAAKHLAERQVGAIWISNRTQEKAEEVLKELDATVIPFEDVFQRLAEVDIVVASMAAEAYVIRSHHVEEAMRQRKNRPMFFIDISVPRNIDPGINGIENVYLYDVDHLQGIADTNLKERESEARHAEAMIADEVTNFMSYVKQMEVTPTIRQLSEKFDLIRRRELDKYLGRHAAFGPAEKEDLEACTKAIVKKILHEPIITMKTEVSQEGGFRYSEFLRKIFKLEGES